MKIKQCTFVTHFALFHFRIYLEAHVEAKWTQKAGSFLAPIRTEISEASVDFYLSPRKTCSNAVRQLNLSKLAKEMCQGYK